VKHKYIGPKQGSPMNVSLPKEFTNFVAKCVDSGEYKSASAVIRAALVLLQEVIRERDECDERDNLRLSSFQEEYLRSLPGIRTEDIDRGVVRRTAGKLAPQKSGRVRRHEPRAS
jgi:putative addiction module CopG family antidote